MTLLFEIRFYTGVPGTSQLSQIRPYFTKTTPERDCCLQCSPWGWGGRAGQNPAASVVGSAEEGGEEDYGLTGDRFVCLVGVEGLPAMVLGGLVH
jgi:hypothetical protein